MSLLYFPIFSKRLWNVLKTRCKYFVKQSEIMADMLLGNFQNIPKISWNSPKHNTHCHKRPVLSSTTIKNMLNTFWKCHKPIYSGISTSTYHLNWTTLWNFQRLTVLFSTKWRLCVVFITNILLSNSLLLEVSCISKAF